MAEDYFHFLYACCFRLCNSWRLLPLFICMLFLSSYRLYCSRGQGQGFDDETHDIERVQ